MITNSDRLASLALRCMQVLLGGVHCLADPLLRDIRSRGTTTTWCLLIIMMSIKLVVDHCDSTHICAPSHAD